MAAIDIDTLLSDILLAAKGVVAKDLQDLRGFSQQTLTMITEQAAFIAQSRLDGSISEELYDSLTAGLARITKKFVTAIIGMATIVMEKVWNAIVEVLWKAIDGVVGHIIPIPSWR